MTAIDLADVVVARANAVALAGVSLQVAEGDAVGIAGHNGAGKSTLLRVINGLVRPRSGRVTILGQDGHPRLWRRLRCRIAYVPQVRHTDPRMPVRAREVALMGRYGRLGLLRRPGPADHEAVHAALHAVGVEHVAGEPFGRLSGGEQQRVLIARALAQEAPILLLDEPTNSLDGEARERLRDVIRRAREERRLTVVLVSHDASALAAVCDRIVVLSAGRVVDECPASAFDGAGLVGALREDSH